MQLEKVVKYHKALADPTRIRFLILLANGELNGLDLAERLGVTPATVTHHAAKLRDASLIKERRDKNTIYFSLHPSNIKSMSEATVNLIYRTTKGGLEMIQDEHQRTRDAVIKNFFTKEGRLKNIPSQLKKRLIVLEHLAMKLEKGRKYSETEINDFIRNYHEDYALLRREMIMHQFMFRENQIYELNPPELWTKWYELK